MLYRILPLLMFVPFSAQAIECESISPLKVTMGDAYYDLDNNFSGEPVSKKHPLQQAINALGSVQFRSGQATNTICRSIDGVITPETRTYKLQEASSRFTNNGELDLSVWLHDVEGRDLKRQIMTLPLSMAWEPGRTKNEWLLSQRFRRLGASLVEKDFTLTVLDNGIGITQITYTNGYFAEESNWTLLKR